MTGTPPVPSRYAAAGIAEFRLAGFRINPLSGDEVVATVANAVAGRQRLIMANINFHAMALAFESEAMNGLLNQPDTLVMIDSMPLLFLANLRGHGLSRRKRTTSLEFYDAMFSLGARKGWRFAYVGATQDTLVRGLAVLRQRHPGLSIDGRNGYFDMRDWSSGSVQNEIVEWLARESHDIVIVGMGMPRQEEWIASIQHRVSSRVFLPTGAYLDYQIGVQKLAPRWLGQIGLEWAFRLAMSPRRLSYRYLIEPLLLARRIVASRRRPGGGKP